MGNKGTISYNPMEMETSNPVNDTMQMIHCVLDKTKSGMSFFIPFGTFARIGSTSLLRLQHVVNDLG